MCDRAAATGRDYPIPAISERKLRQMERAAAQAAAIAEQEREVEALAQIASPSGAAGGAGDARLDGAAVAAAVGPGSGAAAVAAGSVVAAAVGPGSGATTIAVAEAAATTTGAAAGVVAESAAAAVSSSTACGEDCGGPQGALREEHVLRVSEAMLQGRLAVAALAVDTGEGVGSAVAAAGPEGEGREGGHGGQLVDCLESEDGAPSAKRQQLGSR